MKLCKLTQLPPTFWVNGLGHNQVSIIQGFACHSWHPLNQPILPEQPGWAADRTAVQPMG